MAWAVQAPALQAQDSASKPSIASKTEGMEKMEGFFTVYWDEDQGKAWMEIGPQQMGSEFLYVESLSSGLGSNPVGLDRGQLGGEKVVRFQRMGPKILLIQPNLRYRAVTQNQAEQRAVEQSFATSVLWGATAAAESDGRLLVDLTPFLLRDAHDVTGRLRQSRQGNYRLDESRSALNRARTKNFPDNSEFDVLLTFSTDGDPGRLVSEVTPTPEAVSLHQHYSFIRLPDDGYRPRRHDPRAATISTTLADYAAPLDAPLEKRWALRHRLHKKNPGSVSSEPVEPIVYYVDPGAPPAIRQALVEGASWWNQAFQAAGYRNAFQVKILPEDADPMDVRYNVIQWVHRSTRGWSYGSSVSDPRTGEILKGHVTLGSLRVRQDRLIMEGLRPETASASTLDPHCRAGLFPSLEFLAQLDEDAEPVDVALARIRQLSAHEVGHTLGFAHNFAASTYAGRASVMDYPAPLINVRDDGSLDFSQAYAVGIGEWDKVAVRYAYSHFPEEADEEAELEAIIQEAVGNRYLFISDADARPPSAAHPLANLWDNGSDPVEELDHIMRVRRIALDAFGPGNLAEGEPLALLQDTLVPVYLYHRYQVEATAKVLGGAYYTYALKGDGQPGLSWVPPDRQRKALQALLETLQPSHLAIDPSLLQHLPPLPLGYFDARERFDGRSGRLFDPVGAARIAADMTLSGLLQHQRAARLESSHAIDPQHPDLGEVLDAVFAATWQAQTPSDPWQALIKQEVEQAAVDHAIQLASHSRAAPSVTAAATAKLKEWKSGLEELALSASGRRAAHFDYASQRIQRFLDRPAPAASQPDALSPPPGSPIGSSGNQ
ncbi:MAG TPA: zinc-dependent metalloprotease [Acidobacteriota bacterium]|nr:zinc-dependent metalloprotease [Acidobacteriota bacterium]